MKLLLAILMICLEIGAMDHSDSLTLSHTPALEILDVQVIDQANEYITLADQQYLSETIRSKFTELLKNHCTSSNCLDGANYSIRTTIQMSSNSLLLTLELSSQSEVLFKHTIMSQPTEEGKSNLDNKVMAAINKISNDLIEKIETKKYYYPMEQPEVINVDAAEYQFDHHGLENTFRITLGFASFSEVIASMRYGKSYNGIGVYMGYGLVPLLILSSTSPKLILPTIGLTFKHSKHELNLQFEYQFDNDQHNSYVDYTSLQVYTLQYFRDVGNAKGLGYYIGGGYLIYTKSREHIFTNSKEEIAKISFPMVSFAISFELKAKQ